MRNKDKLSIRIWRFAEASAEGPLAIAALVVLLLIVALGRALFGS
jgi:hypothetical protein